MYALGVSHMNLDTKNFAGEKLMPCVDFNKYFKYWYEDIQVQETQFSRIPNRGDKCEFFDNTSLQTNLKQFTYFLT